MECYYERVPFQSALWPKNAFSAVPNFIHRCRAHMIHVIIVGVTTQANIYQIQYVEILFGVWYKFFLRFVSDDAWMD